MPDLNPTMFSGAKAINASVLDTSKTVSEMSVKPKNDFKHSVFFNIITFGIGYAIVHNLDRRDERRVGELKEGVKDLFSKLDGALTDQNAFGDGESKSFDVKMADENVTVRMTKEGTLYAKMAGSDEEYKLDATAEQLRLKLAEDMFSHPEIFTKAELKKIMPHRTPQEVSKDMVSADASFRRHLYMAAILKLSDLGAHQLEDVTTENLCWLADAALSDEHDGKAATTEALTGKLATIDQQLDAMRFTSQEAEVLIASFKEQTQEVKDTIVVLDEVTLPKEDGKELVSQDYRDFMADMLASIGQNLERIDKLPSAAAEEPEEAEDPEDVEEPDNVEGPEVAEESEDEDDDGGFFGGFFASVKKVGSAIAENVEKFNEVARQAQDPKVKAKSDVVVNILLKHSATVAKVIAAHETGDAADLKAIFGKMAEGDVLRSPLMALSEQLGNFAGPLGLGVAHLKNDLAALEAALVEKLNSLLAQDGGKPQVVTGLAQAYDSLVEHINSALDDVQHGIANELGHNVNVGIPNLSKKDSIDNMLRKIEEGPGASKKFFMDVLRRYVEESPVVDRYAMMSAAIRYGVSHENEAATTAQNLEAFLKGAGPLLHKMLQGFPLAAVPPDYVNIVKNVKENLSPIPKETVEAYLMDVKLRSGGKIASIEAVKRLGAASVGEAVLCRLTGSDGKTKEVVVKMLRPDALVRIQREKELILKIARDNHMEETYAGQLATILEEFDFTSEAANIKLGEIYDKGSKRVKAVKCEPIVAATPSVVVMEKAPGKTANNVIKEAAALTVKATAKQQATAEERQQALAELEKAYSDIERMQKDLCDMASQWVTEAVFGAGAFHGDLHSANIMLDPEKGATMIDFGNVTKLTPQQQEDVTRVIAASCFGAAAKAHFIRGLKGLLGKKPEDSLTGTAAKDREVEEMIGLVLSKGKEDAAGKRIYVILAQLQNLGVTVPDTIFKFSQSQIRLQNTIDELNAKMAAMRQAICNLSGIPLDVAKTGFGLFNGAYQLLGAFSNPALPYSIKALQNRTQRDYVEAKNELGNVQGIDDFVIDSVLDRSQQEVNDGIDAFLNQFGQVERAQRQNAEGLKTAIQEIREANVELNRLNTIEVKDVNEVEGMAELKAEMRRQIKAELPENGVSADEEKISKVCDDAWKRLGDYLLDSIKNKKAWDKGAMSLFMAYFPSLRSMNNVWNTYDEYEQNVATIFWNKVRPLLGMDVASWVTELPPERCSAATLMFLKGYAKILAGDENRKRELRTRSGQLRTQVKTLVAKLRVFANEQVYKRVCKPRMAAAGKMAKPRDFLGCMSSVIMQNAVSAYRRLDSSLLKLRA